MDQSAGDVLEHRITGLQSVQAEAKRASVPKSKNTRQIQEGSKQDDQESKNRNQSKTGSQ